MHEKLYDLNLLLIQNFDDFDWPYRSALGACENKISIVTPLYVTKSDCKNSRRWNSTFQLLAELRYMHPTFWIQSSKKAPIQKKIHKQDLFSTKINHAESDGAVRFGDL